MAQAQAKLKVDRTALLKRHGISAGELSKITLSMADLCFDILVRDASDTSQLLHASAYMQRAINQAIPTASVL